jgi:hypothetical protein
MLGACQSGVARRAPGPAPGSDRRPVLSEITTIVPRLTLWHGRWVAASGEASQVESKSLNGRSSPRCALQSSFERINKK